MRASNYLLIFPSRRKRTPTFEHLDLEQKAIVHNILKKRKYLNDCRSLRYYRNLSDIPWSNEIFLTHIKDHAFTKKTKALLSMSLDSSDPQNIYLSSEQTKNLMLAPPRYLTEKEALILAINVRHHFKESFEYEASNESSSYSGESKKHKILNNISNYVKRTKDKELLSQHMLFRALERFDFALNCEVFHDQPVKIQTKKKKEKYNALLESRSFFLILVKMRKFLEVAIPFMGLIETLLNRFSDAVKWLLQGTRLMVRPALLFSLLEKIYEKLEMPNVATFYHYKKHGHELSKEDQVFLNLEDQILGAA